MMSFLNIIFSVGCAEKNASSNSNADTADADDDSTGDSENDDGDDDDDAADKNDSKSGTTGTILLGTANFGAILTEANAELASNGENELDLEAGFLDSLPAGTIGLESADESSSLNLIESDSPLKTYKWYLSRIEISTDGKDWIEVYNGDFKPFDLINGTAAADTISNSSIPVGTYKYLFMEIGEIKWQRSASACTEEKTMGSQDLAGLLTTGEEVKQYYQDNDIYKMIRESSDKQTTYDEIAELQEKSPEDFLTENGFAY